MADTKVKEFPKLEDWQAPWEKAGTDFDAEQAKKAIYKLTRQAFIDAGKHEEELTTVRGELETEKTAKAELQKKVTEAEDAKITDDTQRALAQLQRTVAELAEGRSTPEKEKTGEPQGTSDADRYRVALHLGLTEKQAARLQGSSYEELLEDGKELAADLGLEVDAVGYDDGQGDPSGMPSRVPSRGTHRTDLGGASGSLTFDPAKERDSLVG